VIVTGFVLGVVVGMFWIVVLGKSGNECDRCHEERRARTEARRRMKEIDKQLSSRRWE